MPGVAIVELAGAGRGRPEGAGGIALRDRLFDRAVEPVVVDQVAVAIGLRKLVPGERADHLVVAAPDGDAGVRGEALHLIAHLGVDLAQEVRRRRVLRAGEHHVLPDEQAAFVAGIVEGVELVEAAAPHPDHVHVGGNRLVEQALDPLLRDARGERIGGDPVCPLGEDRYAVDLEGHRGAGRVRLVDEPQPAQADAFVDAVAGDGDAGRVERLVAIAGRPPQRRFGDGQVEIDGAAVLARHHRLALDFRVGEGEDHRHGTVRACRQLDMRGHRDRSVVVMVLADDRVLDARIVIETQPGLGIDAHHHQAGAPVPAAVALRLAQHVEVIDAVVLGGGDREGLPGRPRRRLLGCRAETDGDRVVAGADHAGKVEPMADETRIETGDRRPVDGDLGDRVEEFELEHRPFVGERLRREGEGAAEFPVRFVHPLNVRLVGADHRIGDASGGNQGGMDVAGDRAGRDRAAVGVVKGPRAGERYVHHGALVKGGKRDKVRARPAVGDRSALTDRLIAV